jgi:predicted transcriptional regulator of viral defense system
MNQQTALRQLTRLDKLGIFVYTFNDLAKLFPSESDKTLLKSINRLISANILDRAVKGVYVFSYSRHKHKYLFETIAAVIRRGYFSYISLESALSEYGVISQIPLGAITFMTTGPSGKFNTCYGLTIEFCRTKRNEITLLDETYVYKDSPMRIATKRRALGDLKRVGRNLNMLDTEELE